MFEKCITIIIITCSITFSVCGSAIPCHLWNGWRLGAYIYMNTNLQICTINQDVLGMNWGLFKTSLFNKNLEL